jgi:phosphosulfolactate synthase (CoM biosynthesis protein A)
MLKEAHLVLFTCVFPSPTYIIDGITWSWGTEQVVHHDFVHTRFICVKGWHMSLLDNYPYTKRGYVTQYASDSMAVTVCGAL